MTAPKWIDPKVSIGNVLTFFSVILAMVISYTQTQDRISAIQNEISIVSRIRESQILRIEAKDAGFDIDIRFLRDQAVSRQEVIVSRLSRIETILERLEKVSTK